MTNPISEHILSFMLAFARDVHPAVRAQVARHWRHGEEWRVFELAGRTLVLVGVGALGGRTGEMATALGMRVLGVRRHPEKEAPGVAQMYGTDQLLPVLPEGDVVVLTVRLTRKTRDRIGEPELRAMKSSA